MRAADLELVFAAAAREGAPCAQQNLAFFAPAPESDSDFRLARRFHKT
jgi:hypothetical protein